MTLVKMMINKLTISTMSKSRIIIDNRRGKNIVVIIISLYYY